jgi:imidazolonepropionase-like amidohydrolase
MRALHPCEAAVSARRARIAARAGPGLAIALLVAACGAQPAVGPAKGGAGVTAFVGGRVQPAPDAPTIADGVVLVSQGVITAVGSRAEIAVPADATVIDCSGATITSGFWNSHVHFTAVAFHQADLASAAGLADGLRALLTSWGVVHAVDTGSFLDNTLALRRRIESGEIPGPSIRTAGTGFVPPGGSPYYLWPARLPELTTPEATAAGVNATLDRGADMIKLFTGSWARRDLIVPMPVDLVRAATDAAHHRGKLVVAHPSNSAGARAAIEGGVDVLVHTFPSELDRRPWDRELPRMMLERKMALVPTLKLFPMELRKARLPENVVERVLGIARDQLRAFAEGGGQVLFGTDVGYITDYDPTDEYVYMQQAGLSYPQILASLTTAPAARFGAAGKTGRLAAGLDADLVVLEGDPGADIRALARVRTTMRAGRVIAGR